MRTTIRKARQHESSTGELARLFEQRLPVLRETIRIPSPEPVRQLTVFVLNFVNRTPDILDVVRESCAATEREDLAETLVCTCVEFFRTPPPLLDARPGLPGAMAKAYLCHRMLEEIDDNCRMTSGLALLPLDLTRSNLVVHQLIGEPLANLLDERVRETCDRLHAVFANAPDPATDPFAGPAELPEQCRHWSYLDERVAAELLPPGLAASPGRTGS